MTAVHPSEQLPVQRDPANQTVVAIDGGNSKTDIVLLRGDGTVLRRGRSGPFVPHMVGAVAAVDSLTDGVSAVLAAEGLESADHIAAYLANADLPSEEDAIRAALVARGWAARVVVDNDTLALLRAGTRSPDAVAVVCGAGINCVGVAANGGRVRYPALGRITGDWGGGLGLAKEVLWSTSRHEDGRGRPTDLTEAVARHFGMTTAVAVAEAVHLGEITDVQMHEIVPILFDTAAAGDPVAAAIVQRQASEIVLLATVTLDRLGLMESPADVVLGGGILRSGHPILLSEVLEGLAREVPQARPIVLTTPPVVGAALLGIEQVWSEVDPPARDAALQALSAQIEKEYEDEP